MCTACGNRPTEKERVLSVFEEQEELIREKFEKVMKEIFCAGMQKAVARYH